MPDIECVVFDWYATLAAPHPDDFWTRLPEIIEEAGGEASQDAIASWGEYSLDHGEHSSSEVDYVAWQRRRLRELFERCDVPPGEVEGLVENVSEIRYSRRFTVFDDVPGVLEQLRTDGYRVGLCTNWDWDIECQLEHNAIAHLFDGVVCSAVVGYRKPHPAIFDVVVETMDVPPERILFVGDGLTADIEGATGAGFNPVHIARFDPCPPDTHDGVPCIRVLPQLCVERGSVGA